MSNIEKKQIENISKGLILFSSLATANFDPNQDKERREHFMLYISGIAYGLCRIVDASEELTIFFGRKALTIGVPNNYPFAKCDIVNYSENSASSIMKYIGEGKATDFENGIIQQGMSDIIRFLLNEDQSVTNNFYEKFVA